MFTKDIQIMKKPLRIGIVGGGSESAIGPAHIAAIRMDGAFTLGPSIFSHIYELNEVSHHYYGVPWLGHFDNLASWLDASINQLDLVALLTPSIDHAQQLEQIISRGLSFLVEKPVACSVYEKNVICDALAVAPNVKAHFVHNYSGYPMFREMVIRLRGDKIGPIRDVRIEMPSDGFARERIIGKPQVWRQKDGEVPMVMLDLGTHMHHLVRMVIGKSSGRVQARMQKMANSLGLIDSVEIWEQRDDGISVSYWMSKAHLGAKNGLKIEVYGRDGAFIWYQADPDHLIEIDMNSNRNIVNRGAISAEASKHDRFKAGHPTGFVEAFASFYSDLAAELSEEAHAIQDHSWIRPMEDAFDGISFLAAAARSQVSGEWENI
jgi:predicted dehydrogenase